MKIEIINRNRLALAGCWVPSQHGGLSVPREYIIVHSNTHIKSCIVLVSFSDGAGELPWNLKRAFELCIIKWSYHNYPPLLFTPCSTLAIPFHCNTSRSGCGCSDGCLFILVKSTCRFNSHLNLRPTKTIRWNIRVILLVYELECIMYKQSLRIQPATNSIPIPSSYHPHI